MHPAAAPGPTQRQGPAPLVTVGFVLAGGAVVFVLGLVTGMKTFGVLMALIMAVLIAFASGNPRLFTLWGLMLAVPLTISNRFGPMFVGKQGGEDAFRIEISDPFLIVLVGFLLWDLISDRAPGLRIPKLALPWAGLIVIGCAWVVVGPWRTTAAHEVLRMIKVLVLFLVLVNEITTPRKVWHCSVALAVGGLIQGTIGMLQYAKGGLFGLEFLGETSEMNIAVLASTSVQGSDVFRPSALLQHANLMGMFLAVVLPVSIALLMTTRRLAPRILYFAVLAAASPAVVISLSRSAWVSAAVGVTLVFVFMMLHPSLRWRSFRVGGLVAVIGFVVVASLSGPIIQRAFSSKSNSSVAREIYKADAREMIAESPLFGHGLNAYVFVLPQFTGLSMQTYGGTLPAVHHIYYLWWAETGIIGLLLFLTAWGWIVLTAIGNLRIRDPVLFAINAACLAAMLSLVPDSFLSFTIRVNTMLRVFWVLAALIVVIRYLRIDEVRARVRDSASAAHPAPSAAARSVT